MRNGAAKLPLESLRTDTDVPLFEFSMFTCAPGTVWPLGSVTMPTMLPVVTCAWLSRGHETAARTASTSAARTPRLTLTQPMAASLAFAPRPTSCAHRSDSNPGDRYQR